MQAQTLDEIITRLNAGPDDQEAALLLCDALLLLNQATIVDCFLNRRKS